MPSTLEQAHTNPGRPKPRPARRKAWTRFPAALLLLMLPLTGCVEISRTEKGRYGNPLENYSAGPRMSFEAENAPPPSAQKPWYERLFDW